MPSLFHVRPIQIEKMWQVYVFFYVFFWLFGENIIPLHWFCNMLIINTYFDSCNMDATSGANALIVNNS